MMTERYERWDKTSEQAGESQLDPGTQRQAAPPFKHLTTV